MVVKIVMTTYAPNVERAAYATPVILSMLGNLRSTPDEPLMLHVADDGTPEDIVPHHAADMAWLASGQWPGSSYSITPRKGIGGSLNAALALVGHDDLWLYNTDDWRLDAPLDLAPAITLIRKHGYHYVRLGPTHPNLECTIKYEQNVGFWLRLHPKYGGYCFGTRPFIASRRFYEIVGPFPEYLNAYETERIYAEAVQKEYDRLLLAEIGDLNGTWTHIGEFPVGKIELTTPTSP